MSFSKTVALRLIGPLQSWSYNSFFTHRNTQSMPTKSGVAGICCAALGYSRGSKEEAEFLPAFNALLMTSLAVLPISSENQEETFFVADPVGKSLERIEDKARTFHSSSATICKLQDFRTILNAVNNYNKDTGFPVISYQDYLVGARFFVLLSGQEETVLRIAEGLKDPVWSLFLGRKSCIPSAPIYAGVFANTEEANYAIRREFRPYLCEEEKVKWELGVVTIPDVARSFDPRQRTCLQRLVKREYL